MSVKGCVVPPGDAIVVLGLAFCAECRGELDSEPHTDNWPEHAEDGPYVHCRCLCPSCSRHRGLDETEDDLRGASDHAA